MERGYWIRSKPVYSTLVWQQQANAHIVLVEGSAGGLAAMKLFQQMHPEHPTKVLYARNPVVQQDLSIPLSKVVPDTLLMFETTEESLVAFEAYLSTACMGLRIYVAGSERFIWQVAQTADKYGIEDSEIIKELVGTLARPIYCVHCKTISYEAHTNIKKCDGCGKQLFVRDHFSRRLGAYMGLMVDAEDPGRIPSIEEIYP